MKRQFKRLRLCCTKKVLLKKRFIKRKGVEKARETLKDIHDMIIEMDADPKNSIRLVTENTDFPSLGLGHIDAASLYQKIIQLSKEVEQQREVTNSRCDEDNNLLASDLKSFRDELQAVAEETKKSAKQMSEKLPNICSEINQTDMKLSSIKHDLSQMKQSVRINYLHEGSMPGIWTRDDRIVDFYSPILSCFGKMISVSDPNPVLVETILSASENYPKVCCDAQHTFLCCVYFAS